MRVWILRVLVYVLALFVSFWLIIPAIEGTIGVLLAAFFAALLFSGEVLLTAKLKDEPIEKTVSSRIIMVDKILTPRDSREQEEAQLEENNEIVEAEVIEEQRHKPLPPK